MRISVSNLAWEAHLDASIADVLAAAGIDAIDIVPGRYFGNPARVSAADVEHVRKSWADRGIAIVGLQSLLYGTHGLNLFGDQSSQDAMLAHLADVSRLAGEFGAQWLVFGSPKNRDASGWESERAFAHAVDFFRRAGDRAAGYGVALCLEANPARYGCNFMKSTDEAAAVVRAAHHPAVRLQFDTGTLAVNREDVDVMLAAHGSLVGHVHASEPGLVVVGEGTTDHTRMGPALAAALPSRTVAIEMVVPAGRDPADAVAAAVGVVRQNYAAQ